MNIHLIFQLFTYLLFFYEVDFPAERERECPVYMCISRPVIKFLFFFQMSEEPWAVTRVKGERNLWYKTISTLVVVLQNRDIEAATTPTQCTGATLPYSK